MRKLILTLTTLAGLALVAPAPAASDASALRIVPSGINFGTRPVGTENYDSVTITNTSSSDLLLLVSSELPDDFGFGLLPGSTCPALSPGGILAPGETCEAVVRFSPTEFFAGQHQTGRLVVTARDPTTGAVIETEVISVRGRGR